MAKKHLRTVKSSGDVHGLIPVCPSRPGLEGHGEGLHYNKKDYYYRHGCRIPKDKIVHLTYEGGYCGRQVGDKEYIIVAWDGKEFSVLEHLYSDVRLKLDRFKNLTPAMGIDLVRSEQKKLEEDWARRPKCICGRPLIMFQDDQPKDQCINCYEQSKHD